MSRTTMPPVLRRTLPAAVAGFLALAALTACAGQAAPPAAEPSASADPAPSVVTTPTSSPQPSAPAAEISCDSMISAGTVEALTQAGWSAEPKEFVIGDLELTEGMLCFWADYTVGSDHGQLYGWSEITAEEAARAQSALVSGGWRREEGTEGEYFTEDPQYSMGTDDDGYGMTYLFGDGWVKLADTKQGLVLIEWAG